MDMKKAIERLDEEFVNKFKKQKYPRDYNWTCAYVDESLDTMTNYLHSRDKALLEAVKGEIEKARLSIPEKDERLHKQVIRQCLICGNEGLNKALSVIDHFIKEVSG